ncbi:MAG: hypothetical protein IKP22_09655 [Clostridia bacterium]|nr:hypothetical protein [Clostridia bacterium]
MTRLFAKKTLKTPLPDDPDALVALSDKLIGDPWKRRECLEKAVAVAPDSLKARYALLMLGDLGTGGKRDADFSRIKSYLLTPFEKPERFDASQTRRMAREIFDHPLLRECLGMAGDREKFLRAYLLDLACEYSDLFIVSSAEHSGAVLGFSTASSRLRAMSGAFANLLEGVRSCPYLSADERSMLLSAVGEAAKRFTHGDMSRIYDALEEEAAKDVRKREDDPFPGGR